MGSALHVPLPSGLQSEAKISVKIEYETTKDCTALQWLDKEYYDRFQTQSVNLFT